ncbi:TAXI family TRAP transporter solute-binding subunit [Undibacterium sp. Ren11W]|uniref:TAXI family TRAP transporter solute-binding subunit n=1 Tax=Undibacterium sp. Ren11W TaxID=3413045 RepID=UPI003BF2860D
MASKPTQFRRNRKNLFFSRKMLIFSIPVLIAIGMTVWFASQFLAPALPKKVVIASGADGGAYQTLARSYAAALKEQGVIVEVRASQGSVENYQKLKDETSDVDIGFIQSGIGNSKEAPDLETIAALYYEPVWVFYRDEKSLEKLNQLIGKKIAINLPGSGVHKVAMDLLHEYGISSQNSQLLQLSTQQTALNLQQGKLDAGFFIAAVDAPVIQTLLKSDLKLMHFAQADALVRKFPSLTKVIFPRGAINLELDLPASDISLVSATALLVAKDSLHPAINYLLLSSLVEMHRAAGFFSSHNEFPNQNTDDFPVTDESKRYFKSGEPFLQRYLPFWLANLIERLLIILLPLFAMLIPLFQVMPKLYTYIIKRDLIRWYGEIKLLEDEVWENYPAEPEQFHAWMKEIEEIAAKVNQLEMPQSHFNEIYILKQSIGIVRERILLQQAESGRRAS